jgi:hypothetical protein
MFLKTSNYTRSQSYIHKNIGLYIAFRATQKDEAKVNRPQWEEPEKISVS